MKLTRFQARDPGLVGNVRKGSITVVVVQDVPAKLSDKEIGEPVIVKVSPYAAQSVARTGHAGSFCNVCKRAVVVISIESIHDRNATTVEVTSVDEVNILP